MATVAWGAPTLEFFKLGTSGQSPSADDWSSFEGYFKIPGDILLEGSSQLNTQAGDAKTLKNERGEDVDRKQQPASYSFQTSIIKKKGETVVADNLAPANGVVAGDWAMRITPEDWQTTGFAFHKASITTDKGWSADQGSLDVLNVSGLVPDGTTAAEKEICRDYVAASDPNA